MQLHYNESEETFTMADLFEGLRNAIWSELTENEKINSFRRNLQNAHLEFITAIFLPTEKKYPHDAVAMARADLVALKDLITEALRTQEDKFTRIHLTAVKAQIQDVLDAGKNRWIK